MSYIDDQGNYIQTHLHKCMSCHRWLDCGCRNAHANMMCSGVIYLPEYSTQNICFFRAASFVLKQSPIQVARDYNHDEVVALLKMVYPDYYDKVEIPF